MTNDMLTNKLRPTSFKEVVGHKNNVKILKTIIANPEKSPRTMIFSGEFGCGKTTCARILARELNKNNPTENILNASYYDEYDSAVVGNVEKIREMRDSFSQQIKGTWRVIVFDEVHATSQQAQTALLKVLEEVKGNIFFILCTTHVHKVLDTIRSRSVELNFDLVSREEIAEHISIKAEELGIEFEDPTLPYTIAIKSAGHMRNAHMLLDKYRLIGEEVFKETVKTSSGLYSSFFVGAFTDNKEEVRASVNELMNFSLEDLKTDLGNFIFDLSKVCSGLIEIDDDNVNRLVREVGIEKCNSLIKLYFADWLQNIFRSDVDFGAGMLCLYQIVKPKEQGAQQQVRSNTNSRVLR